MKTSITILTTTLSLLTSAHLIYDASTHAITCPTASGAFCLASSPDLLVTCTGSVGSLSKCAYGTTCSQTSAAAGDAACLAAPKGTYADTIIDSEAEDCECDEPHPPAVSSLKPWAHPLPSSSFTKFVNVTSTPVAPVKSSTTSHGTGTGYPVSTSNVTTLHSSWKPTLTAQSTSVPTTTASPAKVTGNSASGNAANAIAALGVVGFVAALL